MHSVPCTVLPPVSYIYGFLRCCLKLLLLLLLLPPCLQVADIVKLIEQKATEMELRGVMKDVNYDPYSSQGKAKAAAAAAAGGGGKR
jgi:hypothetical protein